MSELTGFFDKYLDWLMNQSPLDDDPRITACIDSMELQMMGIKL